MKHPIWIALAAGLAVLLVALAMPLWHLLGGGVPTTAAGADRAHAGRAASTANAANGSAAGAGAGLPWMIDTFADGRSAVFGVVLGQHRLADLRRRFGDELHVALVARLDELGTLEALVEPMRAGFVSGRLVAGFDVPAATLQRWRSAAGKSQVMAGGARRFELQGADLAEADGMPLVSLSFVPSVRLSADDVRERFGPPQQTQALADEAQALLYPDKGLLVLVQPGSRGVLQYVAPAQFDVRLRAPLADRR